MPSARCCSSGPPAADPRNSFPVRATVGAQPEQAPRKKEFACAQLPWSCPSPLDLRSCSRLHVLNLGILAHVDAGKTSLTERLLYDAGVIDTLGSVDAGTTRTDSMLLERRRGITIRSAVTSFAVGDLAINVIDTPGHPDFIAEVERALAVLDGAVLVLSAVEGVQPQSVVIWRALRRLRVPALIFLNKVDRVGADADRVLGEVRDRLGATALSCSRVDAGSVYSIPPEHELDTLALLDDRMLEAGAGGT